MSRLCLLVLLFWAGCAHRPEGRPYAVVSQPVASPTSEIPPRPALDPMWPPDFRAVQRVIITVGRRQYVCDGLLTAQPEEGFRLALVSPLGLVTEVACSPEGQGSVLRTTALFPERWAHDFVARDLAWLFGPAPEALGMGVLSDGRQVLETLEPGLRRRYVLSGDRVRIEEMEGVEGDRRVYHVWFEGWQTLAPWPSPLPTLIEVDAGRYQLSLRTVQVSLPAPEPEDSQP